MRSEAGRIGIAIRTRRPHGTTKRRTYSLIDRSTGTVLFENVDGLVDLETRLARIAWERELASARGLPAKEAPAQSCPTCATKRTGRFRWCRSCGFDYEATVHQEPQRLAFTLPAEVPARPTGPPPVARPTALLRDVQPERFPALGHGFMDRDLFRSARQVGIGAILGLLIGVIVAIVIAATR
jgi:hypothetical protein